MTLFEVEELCRYWADYPPLHVIGAAILGRRRPPAPEFRPMAAIAAELGPGFAVGDTQGGLPPVILDFAQLQNTTAGLSTAA